MAFKGGRRWLCSHERPWLAVRAGDKREEGMAALSHQKKHLNRASNAHLSFSPHNVERRRMASAAGEPLRQSHTTERDNECDDAPRRRAAPFDGHDPHGRWPG